MTSSNAVMKCTKEKDHKLFTAFDFDFTTNGLYCCSVDELKGRPNPLFKTHQTVTDKHDAHSPLQTSFNTNG